MGSVNEDGQQDDQGAEGQPAQGAGRGVLPPTDPLEYITRQGQPPATATGTDADAQNQQQGQEAGTTFASFDDWYNAQPEPIRKLHDSHDAALRSALDSERDSRKKIAGELDKLKEQIAQIPELQKQAKVAETLQQSVQTITNDLNDTGAERDFYLQAHGAGVDDLALAWLAVQRAGDEVRDRKGNVDFEVLKEKHPNLFARPQRAAPAPTNAGSGLQNPQAPTRRDMDTLIRRESGRL